MTEGSPQPPPTRYGPRRSPRTPRRLAIIAVAVLGVAAGIAGAIAATRLLEKMLFGVKPTDPPAFAAACGLLAGLALVAGYLPGRVAARLNPVETLRCE